VVDLFELHDDARTCKL